MFAHLSTFLIPEYALPDGELPQEMEFVPSTQVNKEFYKLVYCGYRKPLNFFFFNLEEINIHIYVYVFM